MSSRFDSLAAAFDGTSLTHEVYAPAYVLDVACRAVGEAGDLNIITRYDPEDATRGSPIPHTYERLALDELCAVPIRGGVVMHVRDVDHEIVEQVVQQADSFVIIMKGPDALSYVGLFPAGTLVLVSWAPVQWQRCVPAATGTTTYDTLIMYISAGAADTPAFMRAGDSLEMVSLSILDRN